MNEEETCEEQEMKGENEVAGVAGVVVLVGKATTV